jgi:hypothetical protein
MPAQVAIVHGWSDTSKSFHTLRDFLVTNNYPTAQIWLGDYVSMDDDVRVEDVGKRMQQVIETAIADNTLTVPFDMIVHSTGGLVAREWLARYYPNGRSPDGRNCPLKRLIMLAPANFGSRLASLGKSMIGRVVKGWNNWFQTGTEMLHGLELASPYQWTLARRDLLDADGTGEGPYGRDKVWPFVIVGSRGYSEKLRQIVNENGADGTVRCAAANLNTVGLTIDFAANPQDPVLRPWHWRAGAFQFPFAVVPDRNHTSLHEPADDSGAQPQLSQATGRLILDALRCDTPERYGALYESWRAVSEATAALALDAAARGAAFAVSPPAAEELHQYMQVVTLVRDDGGQPVDDYFIEFFPPDQAGDKQTVFFHKEVLEDVHVNSQAASRRCLFVDHTDLMKGYYPMIPSAANRQVAVSISAAPLGDNVRYFDSMRVGAAGHLVVHHEDEAARAAAPARLYRNTTHLVEIIIPRQPIDKVFKLSQ